MMTDRVFKRGHKHVHGMSVWRRIGLVIALCVVSICAAYADDDLPARVGRVALLQGGLFLAPDDQANAWSAIGLNYTITGGDNLWVDPEGHAEIDYGGGQFRLGNDTNVHVSRLDDRQLALFIAQGKLIVRVRFLDPGDSARVDTPNAQVALLRAGLYRIEVSNDRQHTDVTVREGEANVALGSGVQQVLPGQTATIDGADAPMVAVRNGGGVDGFDTWSASRDRHYERGAQTPYVSPQMVGYADLNQNGDWETYPEYGAVWFPANVVVGWAPYRYGYWSSLPGWGSTWVDEAPWGYATTHYGRWVFVGTRWGWCPGSFVARPAWAPALVAWYGGDAWNLSANYGGPVFGWVPLSWREPFHPWWGRCSSGCWNRYNRPYAVDLRERSRVPARYVNGSVPGAMTAVTRDVLLRGRPVQANLLHVPNAALASAPVLPAGQLVRPPRVAAQTLRAGVNGAPPPASTFNPLTKPLALGAGRSVIPPAGPSSVRQAPAPGTAVTAVPGAMPAYRTAPATSAPGAMYGGRQTTAVGGAAAPGSPFNDAQVRPAPPYTPATASPQNLPSRRGELTSTRALPAPEAMRPAPLQQYPSPALPSTRAAPQAAQPSAPLPVERGIHAVPQAQAPAPAPVERPMRSIPVPPSMAPARPMAPQPMPQAAPAMPHVAPQPMHTAPVPRAAPAPAPERREAPPKPVAPAP